MAAPFPMALHCGDDVFPRSGPRLFYPFPQVSRDTNYLTRQKIHKTIDICLAAQL